MGLASSGMVVPYALRIPNPSRFRVTFVINSFRFVSYLIFISWSHLRLLSAQLTKASGHLSSGFVYLRSCSGAERNISRPGGFTHILLECYTGAVLNFKR